ncbi:DNA-binding NtrC family response regulator [Desulfobaculum xiamenense]|uniref:DNA-binding NtrC family response regulator n=1 Tax=Desulfobaculum xiamenense TaxID=995050 RepID=A0A846QMB7_9BACT|nr:sigma-54 dependent transcriptional regulator [Desulfobaculum xiamenense]NJB69251.1 DNA-binding NtrC family response regulator [Desulfobaculum xiamenense]
MQIHNAQPEAILIVDDQEDFARGLARLLKREFPDVATRTATSGDEALDILSRERVSLMFSDLRMPGIGGIELLRQALAAEPNLSVVMLTGYGSIESAVEALKAGAYDFLTKPVEPDALFRATAKGLERARLLGENSRLRELMAKSELGTALIGESAPMKRLKETIAAVAASDYTVLITGESGTGKEMVARAVQSVSARAAKSFLQVNCPAIPEQLLESELFGHVKGAFTGADRSRKGLFVAADGGTLLLDEIGDIPMNIQTKLLRVLQEREVRPVGSSASVRVDVRILASTNQDLERKMREGLFREDLFYRLNVLNVHVPALNRRTEDIPLLAHHFLSQACREMRLMPKEIAPEVLAWLTSRPWPGNVREMQNFMRRLAVFSQGDVIDLALVRLAEARPDAEPADDSLPPYKDAKSRVMDEFTRNYVTELLRKTAGNISEAARVSGLERVSLQKILRRLDIDAERYRRA